MAEGSTLIIWDRLGDYHRARVQAFEKLTGEAVYTADLGSADKLYGWEATKQDGRHFILSEKPVDERDLLARLKAFRKLLKDYKITRVAIAGYAHPEYVLFLLFARLHGSRIVMFAESWYGKGKFRNWVKGLFLRKFVDVFFVSGMRAREHFHQHLGIPDERIIEKYSVVDNQHFAPDPDRVRQKIILCVARFSPEKNLPRLMEAFQESRLSNDHVLRIIGGGPQKALLENLIEKPEQVELVDWVGYADLPAEYGRARYFILPSLFEPWGLVINEAMASGLPVIASSACGCASDLVNTENGFLFPAEDRAKLVDLLNHLAGINDNDWEELSAASLRIISGYSCEDWAGQLKKGFLNNADH